LSKTINVNGVTIQYPETGDTGWGDEATDFAIQTSAAFSALGLSTGTSVDIPGTLDVTGATTLDSTLDVGGTLDVSGNTNLSGTINVAQASIFQSTVTITDDLAVDTDTLFVDVSADKVGINKSNPSVELDVFGSAAISGTLTAGTFAPTDIAVDTNLIKTDSTQNFVGINKTSPTEALDVVGNIKQSGVLLNADGSATSPSITFTSDTNTGLYRIGNDNIGIAVGGSKVGEVQSSFGGFKGNVIQIQYAELTTTGTTSPSTIIGFDDTIPQSNEGTEVLTLSITPKFSNSLLVVESNIFIGENSNSTNAIAAAIFKDSDSNAIASRFVAGMSSGAVPMGANLAHDFMYMQKILTSGSTNLTTFKTRISPADAMATIRWNGTSARFGGGSMISWMKITEVMQ